MNTTTSLPGGDTGVAILFFTPSLTPIAAAPDPGAAALEKSFISLYTAPMQYSLMVLATSVACFLLAGAAIQASGAQYGSAGDYRQCGQCHTDISHAKGHVMDCGQCHLPASLQEKTAPAPNHDVVIARPAGPEHVQRVCGACHAEQVRRVARSLHGTMAGIINQTRYLWGAQTDAKPRFSANDALRTIPQTTPEQLAKAHSPALLVDDMLRRRCLRCHINAVPPPEPSLQRGVGCAACHMVYGHDGKPVSHKLTAAIPDSQCLRCHNANHTGADAHGLFERDFDLFFQRAVTDGRQPERRYGGTYHHLARDLHTERGMACLDCHTSHGVMGYGRPQGFTLERTWVSCEDCHAGFDRTTPRHAAATTAAKGWIFTDRKGQKRPLPLFQENGLSHSPDHRRLRCSSCHAQWSFQDYGIELSLLMGGDVTAWRYLAVQSDPQVEETLSAAVNQGKSLESKDWLTGQSLPGAWLMAYRFRRWETMPLGLDHQDRVCVLRPKGQYRVSYVDRKGSAIIDGEVPFRGDGAGPGMAFEPYVPHTLGAAGRSCQSCHGNVLAAGLTLQDATAVAIHGPMAADLAVYRASAPSQPSMSLLDGRALKALLTPPQKVKKRMAKAQLSVKKEHP